MMLHVGRPFRTSCRFVGCSPATVCWIVALLLLLLCGVDLGACDTTASLLVTMLYATIDQTVFAEIM